MRLTGDKKIVSMCRTGKLQRKTANLRIAFIFTKLNSFLLALVSPCTYRLQKGERGELLHKSVFEQGWLTYLGLEIADF